MICTLHVANRFSIGFWVPEKSSYNSVELCKTLVENGTKVECTWASLKLRTSGFLSTSLSGPSRAWTRVRVPALFLCIDSVRYQSWDLRQLAALSLPCAALSWVCVCVFCLLPTQCTTGNCWYAFLSTMKEVLSQQTALAKCPDEVLDNKVKLSFQWEGTWGDRLVSRAASAKKNV